MWYACPPKIAISHNLFSPLVWLKFCFFPISMRVLTCLIRRALYQDYQEVAHNSMPRAPLFEFFLPSPSFLKKSQRFGMFSHVQYMPTLYSNLLILNDHRGLQYPIYRECSVSILWECRSEPTRIQWNDISAFDRCPIWWDSQPK